MFKPVGSKVNLPELEEAILRFWKERGIFERSVEQSASGGGRATFVFYEGPPTANASPGVHHVLSRAFKDIIPRYKTMRGYRVPRIGGWDTHGLPVELEVERELGFSSKTQIEEYGIERFNQRCRESVFRYVKEWESLTERIGFWIDMERAYITYTNDYIESCWWIVKQLWEKGLVYQGYKVTPHCPRCGTSLSDHEVALGYKDDAQDPSVYVKFRLDPASTNRGRILPKELKSTLPTYFLAWTTTPWTLPGNTALAVAPEAHYALVKVGGGERLILAEALLGQAIKGPYQIVATVLGMELEGLKYQPLFPGAGREYRMVYLEAEGFQVAGSQEVTSEAHRIVTGDFISLEEGTGIVHIAPAYGEIDLEVGRAEGLPLVHTVELDGAVHSGLPGEGRFVKDADPLIIADLNSRGLLYRSETITHTYPFCWRCDAPLLYYAKTSWYFRTTAVKDELIRLNQEISWYPEHIREGRFGDWLRNNVDWAISRERYWGTPLPIWHCPRCGKDDCLGGVAELKRKPGLAGYSEAMDLHRPFVDGVTFQCAKCGGNMQRIPEVMDCWFDSGAMPYAQWGYPHREGSRETFPANFPADFICEAVDQTRGWFYSLHAVSTLLYNSICYRNVICLGHILDSKGEKMSKSKGNVVDPWEVIAQHGADALRWYLYTASPPGNPRRFSLELVGEAVRKFLLTLWNTYSFFVTYANIDRFQPGVATPEQLSPLDRWILSELNQLILDVTRFLDEYDPTSAGRRIQDFVDNLSNWYVRRSRRRFWKSENDADKWAAYSTLYQCLVTTARLLAPFVPFMAEELYQNLVRSWNPSASESVHLTDWPQADEALIDQGIMADTRLLMKIASLGRAARSSAGIKVRQPLPGALIKVRSEGEQEALRHLSSQLLEELNMKEMAFITQDDELVDYRVRPNLALLGPRYGSELATLSAALAAQDPKKIASLVRQREAVSFDGYQLSPEELVVESVPKPGYAVAEEGGYLVGVSLALTPELKAEGLARELVHRLQTMRRSAGFDVADHIVTYYQGPEEVCRVMERFADYVRQETLSRSLVQAVPEPGAYQENHRIEGHPVTLGVKRVD